MSSAQAAEVPVVWPAEEGGAAMAPQPPAARTARKSSPLPAELTDIYLLCRGDALISRDGCGVSVCVSRRIAEGGAHMAALAWRVASGTTMEDVPPTN